jgi:hypothetical protein
MRQKLGSNPLENLNIPSTGLAQQIPNRNLTSEAPSPPKPNQQNKNFTEKKSRPPKMRLKKYLEVDTDICHKRPTEDQNGVSDKRRRLELGTLVEVSTILLCCS